LYAAYGDSGSWVVETGSGNLYGHIIAGDLSTGLGYVLPTQAVFQQIEHQLDCRIELPESGILVSEPFNDPTNPLDAKEELEQPSSSTTAREEVAQLDKGKGKDSALPQDLEAPVPVAEPILEKREKNMDPPEPEIPPLLTTSFLFVVNELPTNDNPATPGSIPARYVNGRWHPPVTIRGFFAQVPGHVYRWNDGAVSLADEYEWTARPIVDYAGAPFANGTIIGRDSEGQFISPTYFRAATVFYCNHFDKFVTTRGDAGTREMAISDDAGDWWQPLSFFHDRDISYINHAGDQEFLAVRNATWIEQLLPRVYRRRQHGGPAQGGLAGLLPIIIALVAFSCTNMVELYRILIEDKAWSGHRWRPHERESGRFEGRGMVVTVFLDPQNPHGSTMERVHEIEDGRTPIFR
jgi:hypothetical protein